MNHYIPDMQNPYNNMVMENPEIDELEKMIIPYYVIIVKSR